MSPVETAHRSQFHYTIHAEPSSLSIHINAGCGLYLGTIATFGCAVAAPLRRGRIPARRQSHT